MNFATTDMVVLIGYLLCMMGFGIWIANKEKNENAKDYFLASSALPWWAVGGSLIASNISTEQILGMNGSGYVMGLAIGAYELLAALTLILVAKFLLPVFIKKKIFTMPQFLEERFDRRVRTIMAFFWVALFVLVNITSVLYLGGLAIQSIIGVPLLWGILGLVIYSATFSIFGGLKAVVWSDVAQVVILIVGGFTAAYMVLAFVGNGSFFGGLAHLYEKAPDHFDMILDKANKSYNTLPGISVLVGGMWIANLYYWGNNQYIIQRALAAKSLQEAQDGVAFAAIMKLTIPFFAVIPGIAAYVIMQDPAAYGFTGKGLSVPDEAFPWVLGNFVQTGFKGLVLAALIAAIGSSVSSMVNSASTIFTLDIYKNLFVKNGGEHHYVKVGRVSSTAALVIGAIIAPALGSLDQVFQYIQEYTGFISPGVVAVFLFGMFWKRATANSALVAVVASIPFSWMMQAVFPEVPFLVRMALSFVVMSALVVLISVFAPKESVREKQAAKTKRAKETPFLLGLVFSIVLISVPAGIRILAGDIETSNVFGLLILGLSAIIFALLFTENKVDDEKAIQLDRSLFHTDAVFNISALVVCLILVGIYWFLW
ncbi:MAG TPA: sodium/glucose cotransporter [Bacteroidetes bacterium]|nr:sodium/glucose cotransporter [Bacteroidota bacterium]